MMDFALHITGFVAIYIFMLTAFAGWVIIGGVPAILHTPLMSGSNFVHGIVVVGGMYALLNASTIEEQVIGFCAAGGGQCRGRLCRHAPYAGDVPAQQARTPSRKGGPSQTSPRQAGLRS
jgi:NAD(P) transhydrogenase subunit alpha